MKQEDMIGKKFGLLTVLGLAGRNKYGKSVIECSCECGGTKITEYGHVAAGRVKSCGCLRKRQEATCSIEGCDNQVESRGWCSKHYARWTRFGDPEKVLVKYGSLEERFKTKYKVNDKTDCWEWTAHKTNAGYGHINDSGTARFAHRVSWEIFREKIPDGMCICHKCNNPPCVNPDHLYVGTYQDNYNDMVDAGRRVLLFGDDNPRAKLSTEDIREIVASDLPHKEIAKKFNVSSGHISRIKNGRRRQRCSGVEL